MHEEELHVYVDGSCYPNPGPGGWGLVMQYHGHEKELFGGVKAATNNTMELEAVIQAVQAIKWGTVYTKELEVTIFSDSAYVVKGITEYCAGWKRRGWKKSNGEEPSNLAQWKWLYDNLIMPHRGRYLMKKVKGHSGVPGNERADELANQGRHSLT